MVSIFILFFFVCPNFSLFSSEPQNFESIAKVAIPAVVSIRSSIKCEKSSFSEPHSCDDGENWSSLFDTNFWQQILDWKRSSKKDRNSFSRQGSGFLISSDGYIVTSAHVIHDASKICISLDDQRIFPAKLIGEDSSSDLALLKISATNLPFLSFAKVSDLTIGQWVVAIGNPLGLQTSLTVGVVSATGSNNEELNSLKDFIQTDAAINQGNSGGPLLNLKGEVIGVNTALASTNGNWMGIGFAIPCAIASDTIDALLSLNSLPKRFLGVVLQPLDKDLIDTLSLQHLEKKEGVFVTDVAKESPAEKAGVQKGDIIIAINGSPATSIEAVRNAIALTPSASNATLTVQRYNQNMSVTVEFTDTATLPFHTIKQ